MSRRGTVQPSRHTRRSACKREPRPEKWRMETLPAIDRAVTEGKLLESSAANIRRTLGGTSSPVASQSVRELTDAGEWTELNDRFYRALAFGTGGIRGRTIGKIVTDAERGT